MNPSFKPPPPLSDLQKDIIFQQFLADPLLHSPRRIAQRYHLSLKRVDAILRLKGLERHFTKVSPLSVYTMYPQFPLADIYMMLFRLVL